MEMTDEEFLEKYPVCKYHGIRFQDGNVIGRFSNPKIAEGIFGDTERGIFELLKGQEAHLQICPMDVRAVAEVEVNKQALADIQAEKIRLGLPLEVPRLGHKPQLSLVLGGPNLS